MRTPYIEGYLSRPDSDLERRDLLWQYYSRIGSYGKAASVLQSLAELTEYAPTIVILPSERMSAPDAPAITDSLYLFLPEPV